MAQSHPVTAFFDHKVFLVPGEGRMVETYLKIIGESVDYATISDSTWQAEVEVQILITEGEQIHDFRKTALKSPISTQGHRTDFTDIQRFIVPKGNYSIELKVQDVNRKGSEAATLKQQLSVDHSIKQVFFSDIELVAAWKNSSLESKYSKSGLDIIPYMSNVYYTEFNEVFFYFELYNTHKKIADNGEFLLKYFLREANREAVQKGCIKLEKKKASEVTTAMGVFDISNVRAGAYDIVLEARDRENNLLAEQSIRIVRLNDNTAPLTVEEIDRTFVKKFLSKDSLIEHIRSLLPLAQDQELHAINQYGDNMTLLEMKSFFYSFWERRNLMEPEKEWEEYKAAVVEAEEKFGTSLKKGYETDMGRVFLKYGPPNTVVDDAYDAESYPFQIWHYYKAGRFSDGRFVFYDESLLQSDYVLLHSDVPGERRNLRWNRIIHSRNNAMNSFDETGAAGESSRRLQELFDNPR